VVNVYDAASGAFKYQFTPFDPGFTGAVRVAVGRANGQDVIAVAAGPGGFLVRTFVAGPTGVAPVGQIQPFGTFTGGIFVALGDLNGDGRLEVVTSPDAAPNSDPFLNIWDLNGNRVGPNVFAFEVGFHGGVRVAVGDVTGDGRPEIIASAGPGGFPFVQILNVAAGGALGSPSTYTPGPRFQVFGTGFQGGVRVATGVLDASGIARILVGADAGDNAPFDEPVMRTFSGSGTLLTDDVFAFEASCHGGTTRDGRGQAWVLAAPARTHAPQVDIFSAGFALLPQSFTVLDAATKLADANFADGVAVGV
jgi:hypothetical protein